MNDTPTTGYSDHLVGNKTTLPQQPIPVHLARGDSQEFINQTLRNPVHPGSPTKMQTPGQGWAGARHPAGRSVFPSMDQLTPSLLGCTSQSAHLFLGAGKDREES